MPPLASSLQGRFRRRAILSDNDEAVAPHRAAPLLIPPGHYERPGFLGNLAISLGNRGMLSDLDEAIELQEAALLLHPPGHPSRSGSLPDLALTLQERLKQRGILSDLDDAFKLYLQLIHLSHAVSLRDLIAAKSWAASAEEMNHGSALVAYHTALKFLDQHVALLSSSSLHFDAVRKATSSLATDAFSSCLCRGALKAAVELVEQGRAVFWTQLTRFRSPLDQLSLSNDTGAAYGWTRSSIFASCSIITLPHTAPHRHGPCGLLCSSIEGFCNRFLDRICFPRGHFH